MKAKIIPIAFLTGIASVYLSYYFSCEMLFTVPMFTIVLCFVLKFVFKRRTLGLLIVAAWVMLMSLYTVSVSENYYSDIGKYCGDTCTVYGEIINTQSENDVYGTYQIRIDKLADSTGENLQNTDETCLFHVKKGQENRKFHYGDYVEARVTVGEGGEIKNTGETDYALVNKIKKIFYSLEADEENIVYIHGFENVSDMKDIGYVSREYIRNSLGKLLSQESMALLMGILVSDKSYLDHDTRQTLENAGIMHLTAASGLHVSCIVTIITVIMGLFLRRRYSFLVAVPLIFFYVFINGSSVSIIRAAIMIFLFMIAECVDREYDRFISLSCAGIFSILMNPLNIFSVSFVLSFSAVAAIFFLSEEIFGLLDRIKIKKHIEYKLRKYKFKKLIYTLKASFSVCLAVQLVTIPINAYFFGYISPYALIVNLLISWMVVPIMLFAVLTFATSFCNPLCMVFSFVLEILLKGILMIAGTVGRLPFSRIDVYISAGVAIFCILAVTLIFNCIKKKKTTAWVLASVCAAMVINSVAAYAMKQRYVQINFVNVGQGDGCFIEYGNGKAIVIDGGGNNLTDDDNIFTPYMKRCGVKTVEIIFVSHFETDHAKNVLAVMDNFNVKNIVVPIRKNKNELACRILDMAQEKGCNIIYAKEGMVIEISDDIKAKVYAPAENMAAGPDENMGSMAVKFEIADKSVLFLGDLPAPLQNKMARKYKDELDCDILKLSHHGAFDGYCKNLIEYATPEHIVISCGDENIFEHPAKQVRKALAKRKLKTFITRECGDIKFSIDKKGKRNIRVQTMAGDMDNGEARY